MSKNLETIRAAHESWNRRDFDGIVRNMVDNVVYTDRARNLTLSSRQKFKEWTQAWAKAFSDGRITNSQYLDAGDVVVTTFTVEGTNDSSFNGLPPTGRRVTFTYWEISRLDKNGRTISGEGYYDQYTILTQLGLVQPLAAAA